MYVVGVEDVLLLLFFYRGTHTVDGKLFCVRTKGITSMVMNPIPLKAISEWHYFLSTTFSFYGNIAGTGTLTWRAAKTYDMPKESQ